MSPSERCTRTADGLVHGVEAVDLETGQSLTVPAKCVINATGPFCDAIRHLDEPTAKPLIAPSQGIHLVFDGSFLPSDSAIMVPRTRDGRVMFAIPWNGHTLVGTTDTPIEQAVLDPVPQEEEIEFILATAQQYLAKAPTRSDVLSMFAGIRPLVNAGNDDNTAALSRDHTIHVSRSGLLTITGGKWTTYRHMAEDCVNHAALLAKLEERPCVTKQLRIHGFHKSSDDFGALGFYGSDATSVDALLSSDAELGAPLDEALPYRVGEAVWAARFEMARTVDDFLSRRTRATILNAKAAIAMAPRVAEVLAKELGRDQAWAREQTQEYRRFAESHLV